MKILVVGGGGREHAIITSIAKSSKVTKIYCAPGNAGIAELAECVDIGVMEFDKLVDFAKKEAIDLAVVAPDDPLVAGAVDTFEAAVSVHSVLVQMQRSSKVQRHFPRIL